MSSIQLRGTRGMSLGKTVTATGSVTRYRVLLALRRGEYGEAIHSLLGPVDELLADLVKRGQDTDVFAQHLPAGILSQVAYGVVFAIADSDLSNGTLGARAATITSLLMLGVPETHAIALVGDQP
ncbi:hypothetical protein ABZX95_48285 [Streptomyces sp. NPDC004232]|uniref:hypothetical protein n=1 Tax=Streptomyces sp. NPDC004232 TaxID=3154454 RepID=UPI0033AD5B62